MSRVPEKFKPHGYQTDAMEWLTRDKGGSALFLDMGLGKTCAVLMAFKKLKDEGKAKSMLVIAPLIVAQVTWPHEINKWIDFIGLTYVVIHGPNKEAALRKKADIYITNYESIPWLYKQSWKATDIIVFDELTRMKNWSSLRTKAIKNYLPLYRYRWGLTGTPVPNGLIDIFSQAYMLDLGERFGTRVTKFRDMYFQQPTKWQYKRVPLKGTPQIIYEKLESLAFRVKASDWLDLPEEIHNPILLPFPDELSATYTELKKEFIVRLKTQVITAGSASVLSTKLRQLLSGNIYDANREAVFVHHYKLKALQDFVADCDGRPILVAYQYRHEVEMFREHFSKACFIESTTNSASRVKIIADWNEGKVPLLFGHPASIGHGLNLQGGGNTVLFYSLDFNLENYQQFIKRVARQGQKADTVIIHYLVFENTIDEFILEILQGKADVQNGLLDYLEA